MTPKDIEETNFSHESKKQLTWQISKGRAIFGPIIAYCNGKAAKNRKLVPECAVAIQTRIENGTCKVVPVAGSVYTFLPLPEEVSLFLFVCQFILAHLA